MEYIDILNLYISRIYKFGKISRQEKSSIKCTGHIIIKRAVYKLSGSFMEHLVGPYLLQHHQEGEVKVVIVVVVQGTLETQVVMLKSF